jgi:hypothetical protein
MHVFSSMVFLLAIFDPRRLTPRQYRILKSKYRRKFCHEIFVTFASSISLKS